MAKIKYQFYCKNEEEVRRALARIEKVLPKVHWAAGQKTTEWWNTNVTYPVWLSVWDDNDMTYREFTDHGFSEQSTMPDTVKIYLASSKTDAKKKLKKIHRDLPSVRWHSGDLPSNFIPSINYPIWLEVTSDGDLGYSDSDIGSCVFDDYEQSTDDDTAPSAAEPIAPVTDDPVDHPSHYTHGSTECIDAMVETQGKNAVQHFCVCNAFKYLWRWRGKNGMEDIWFAVKDPKHYCFNVEDVKLRRRVMAPYRTENQPKDWEETPEGRFRMTYPSNFWDDISVPFWSMPENTEHPTQKPEKLFAKLILASSKEGDMVFDPFLGSGTSCVVAKKLNRHYCGIETNTEYCCWAEKRLNIAEADPSIQGYADGVFWERNTLNQQKQNHFKKKK